jgi:hypothetical protein
MVPWIRHPIYPAVVAWDSSRPVPWKRLTTEWLIYAAIMAMLFAFVFRDNVVGALTGLAISFPLYLLFGAVLAKFGYQRKTLRELRRTREQAIATAVSPTAITRPKPPPTKRTGGGRPGGARRARR